MIVPMKKVSIIVLDYERKKALKKLRKIGLLHIEMTQVTSSTCISKLKEQISALEDGIFVVAEKVNKNTAQKKATTEDALSIAKQIASLTEKKKACRSEISVHQAEL